MRSYFTFFCVKTHERNSATLFCVVISIPVWASGKKNNFSTPRNVSFQETHKVKCFVMQKFDFPFFGFIFYRTILPWETFPFISSCLLALVDVKQIVWLVKFDFSIQTANSKAATFQKHNLSCARLTLEALHIWESERRQAYEHENHHERILCDEKRWKTAQNIRSSKWMKEKPLIHSSGPLIASMLMSSKRADLSDNINVEGRNVLSPF